MFNKKVEAWFRAFKAFQDKFYFSLRADKT